MKKILTLAVALTIAFTGIAQNKNGKSHKGKHEKHDKKSHDEKHNDDDRYDDDDDDRRVNRNRHDNGSQGKYSKNLPSKVRQSFNRDFPNANNVNWTKERGYWTASFQNGRFNRTSVTYSANGQRVNGTTANRRKTNSTQDASVLDKIFTRTD